MEYPRGRYALATLRHMLKDELFIRSPSSLVATPRRFDNQPVDVWLRDIIYDVVNCLDVA